MSRSMKSLGNNLVRHAAGWLASFLAVAVALLGRSGSVTAPAAGSDLETYGVAQSEVGAQISYLQVGTEHGDNEDWWPPRPE